MLEEDKYHVLEKIGHGSFGIIRKVKRKEDGLIMCRKEISYSKMSQKEREQLQAELSILKELRHPNIVAYYERDHIKSSQDLHLYMEYCGNGDLGRVIQSWKTKSEMAPEEFVWSILSQTVSALYRCHYGENPPPAGRNVMGLGVTAKPKRDPTKPMILHRDLKPENIFLGEDNSVKLGDFGLSKILQSHDFASTYVGTPFYMSPEICKAEAYTLYSDIWALGCIIYEMCTKQPPFNAKTHFDLIQKIKIGRYPPIPAVYSAELGKVIASCLQVIPNHRPDTAALLNLPCVKMMRKEEEVVRVAQNMRDEKEEAIRMQQEAKRTIAEYTRKFQELDSSLRREWELKARLEIDRQVKQQCDAQIVKLQDQFEAEVTKRVAKALEKYPNRLSTSPRLAPRSNTPTMPAVDQLDIFPSESLEPVQVTSMSTVGNDSSFASGTDISSLSLDENVEEPVQKPAPAKRSRRQPLARAQTMFAAQQPPPSPMDIQMAEPSPAPASIAGLSLSPRRNAPRQNIFAAAKDGAKKWEAEIPPSPTEEEWNGDFDDDDLPVLPSPTRARSASGGRNIHQDPFKSLDTGSRPILKPNQRLASAPSLAPNSTKPRPASAVPIVATSPTRLKTKSVDTSSPTRRTALASQKIADGTSGLKSKRDPNWRVNAMRNNGVQGRTLVELQQARGIPAQAMSEDEGKKGLKAGARSPVKARSANAVAVWDPEIEPEMPSPFIVRSKRMVK